MSDRRVLFSETAFDRAAFGREVQDFIRGGLDIKGSVAAMGEKPALEKPNRHFKMESRQGSWVVVSAESDFSNIGNQKRALDASYLVNTIRSRMDGSKAGQTSSVEDDRTYVAEAYHFLISLETAGRGLRPANSPLPLTELAGDVEVLYYSERQLEIIKRPGDDAGVVLIDGQQKPVLWTETKTAYLTPPLDEDLQHKVFTEITPKTELSSNFQDAVELHRGSGGGYKRLVDGRGEVTEDGIAYCAEHDIQPTPQALRKAALVPVQS